MEKSPKEPLAALLLSLVFPGLGQIYAARIIKGLGFFLFAAGLGLWLVFWFFNPAGKITFFWLICLFLACVFFLWNLSDAYLSAGKYNSANALVNKPDRLIKSLLIAAIISIVSIYSLVFWLIQLRLFMPFTVQPDFMEPTLYKGERVLVDLRAYRNSPPQRGDIVLYRYPQDPARIYMHRIAGLPGESVLLKDHKIFIDKMQLKDEWALKIRHYNGGKFAERRLPALSVPLDSYYVLGDNSARSQDSRYWGCLPAAYLIGKVRKIYFPFARSGPIK